MISHTHALEDEDAEKGTLACAGSSQGEYLRAKLWFVRLNLRLPGSVGTGRNISECFALATPVSFED